MQSFSFPYLEELKVTERCLCSSQNCEGEVKVRHPPSSAQTLCPNHPVTGELFGKTGLVRQRVVGENRVVSWGAGAVGVLTGGRVLLEGHRQVQVLLSEERSEVSGTFIRGETVKNYIVYCRTGLQDSLIIWFFIISYYNKVKFLCFTVQCDMRLYISSDFSINVAFSWQ